MRVREPYNVEFVRPLANGNALRVRLDVSHGQVNRFVIQLETYLDEHWFAVVRYDTAHGRPHRDVLDQRGDVIEKTWLEERDYKGVVKFAELDLIENATAYVAAFLERFR